MPRPSQWGNSCPLLGGFKVEDRCVVSGKPGGLPLTEDAAENPYVVHVTDVGTQTVSNKRASQSVQPLSDFENCA